MFYGCNMALITAEVKIDFKINDIESSKHKTEKAEMSRILDQTS